MINDIEFILRLVRHGESEVNARPDEMGQSADVALTAKGRKQAQLLGEHLKSEKFDFIYASPYKRAYDTAKIAMGDQSIITSPRLREYDAGEWTGCSRTKTLTNDVKLRMGYYDHFFLPPSGESITMVERRASQWLEDCILFNPTMLEAYKDKGAPLNLVAFSHGITIKSLLHSVMGFDKSMTWKIAIWNTSVSTLHFSKVGWAVLGINDCQHLSSFEE